MATDDRIAVRHRRRLADFQCRIAKRADEKLARVDPACPRPGDRDAAAGGTGAIADIGCRSGDIRAFLDQQGTDATSADGQRVRQCPLRDRCDRGAAGRSDPVCNDGSAGDCGCVLLQRERATAAVSDIECIGLEAALVRDVQRPLACRSSAEINHATEKFALRQHVDGAVAVIADIGRTGVRPFPEVAGDRDHADRPIAVGDSRICGREFTPDGQAAIRSAAGSDEEIGSCAIFTIEHHTGLADARIIGGRRGTGAPFPVAVREPVARGGAGPIDRAGVSGARQQWQDADRRQKCPQAGFTRKCLEQNAPVATTAHTRLTVVRTVSRRG